MGRLTDTISGSVASFKAVGKQPIRSLKAYFAPWQEGTGDPSPSNVRAIHGWTGVKVTRAGKNLAASATVLSDTGMYSAVLFIEADLKPSTTYTMSFVGTAGNLCYTNEWLFAYANVSITGSRQSVTFTTKADISRSNESQYYTGRGWTILKNAQSQSAANVFTDIQLEIGSTATAYEQYKGIETEAEFPQEVGTVYGGTLDVISGVLTVNRAKLKASDVASFDGYAALTDNTGGYVYKSNAFPVNQNTKTVISDSYTRKLPLNAWESLTFGQFGASTTLIVTVPPTVTSTAEALTYFASHDAEFVYELATPVEYQLTPAQLQTLIGQNNISCNAGNVEVEYDFAESIEMMKRRREILAQGGKIDTSPKIIADNMRYANKSGTSANNGTSITAIYDLPLLIATADDRQGIAYGIVPSTVNYRDGAAVDYWNQTATDESRQFTLFSYSTNQAAFTIKTDMIDDCFCYHLVSGKILFAGKNSIYYGYKNINDMPT